jgi:hypothetical protein
VVILGAAGILVMAAALVCALVLQDRRMRAMVAEQRRLHLQQANIIAMLMRAGFRGPKAPPDWGDSGNWTRHIAPQQ